MADVRDVQDAAWANKQAETECERLRAEVAVLGEQLEASGA